MNSTLETGPPITPQSQSYAAVMVTPPVDYVWPYPYNNGQHITTFKNLWTSGNNGALPEIINLTLPPNAYLVLLKNTLS